LDIELLLENKRTNRFQSAKLIGGMAAILAVMAVVIMGPWGAVIAIGIAVGITFFGPRVSPAIVLKMFKAQAIHPNQAPELYRLHHALCERAQLEYMPPLFYIPSQMLNAFATGIGNKSAIAVSDGLMRSLNSRELAGVLAHEISHLRHNDMRIMSLADSFSRFASAISRLGLLLFLFALFAGEWQGMWRLAILFFAPALTSLLQLALSRSREFHADMGAAELTRDPEGLAMALQKLEKLQPTHWMRKLLFPGNRAPESTALRTHPPTGERVELLMRLVPQYEHQENLVNSARILDVGEIYRDYFQQILRQPGWHALNGTWH